MDEVIPTGWHIVGIGDFNGDGVSDLLLRSDDGTITDWLGTAGSGDFSANGGNLTTSVDPSWHVAGVGTFNNDVTSDILWQNSSGQIFDFLGTSSGGVTNNGDNSWSPGTGMQVAAVGDFNGDGRDDILWRDASGTITDWLSTPTGGFTVGSGAANTNVGLDWHVAGVGDFNGDGKDDILWRNDNGAVFDFLGSANGGVVNNGDNSWTAVPTSMHIAGIGDFNGDGKADILWRGSDGTITDWLGTSIGGFTDNSATASQPLDLSLTVAGVGDFNGDHKSDMLLQWSDGSLQTWTGSANGAILSPTEKVWADAVQGVRDLANQINIDTIQADIEAQMIKDHSGGVPIPNASAGDLSAEMSAAIGDMWYVDNPSAQSGAPKSTFVDVITMASDPNFLVTYDEGTHIAMDLSNYSDSMDLIDSSTNTFDLNINATDVVSQWHDGAPPAPSSGPAPDFNAIVITGVKPSFTDPTVYVPSGYFTLSPIDSGFNFADGFGGATSLEQQAHDFATQSIKHGPGFDSNNATDKQIEDDVTQVLTKAYLDLHENIASTVKNTDGSPLTDAQLNAVIGQVQVTLQTDAVNVNNDPARFFRATGDDGVVRNYIFIDIDHPNLAALTSDFGGFDEAVMFTALHEIGHAIDNQVGARLGGEAVANYYALQLGQYLGLPVPTPQQMNSASYPVFTPPPPP